MIMMMALWIVFFRDAGGIERIYIPIEWETRRSQDLFLNSILIDRLSIGGSSTISGALRCSHQDQSAMIPFRSRSCGHCVDKQRSSAT